jgi:hypothetical protein
VTAEPNICYFHKMYYWGAECGHCIRERETVRWVEELRDQLLGVEDSSATVEDSTRYLCLDCLTRHPSLGWGKFAECSRCNAKEKDMSKAKWIILAIRLVLDAIRRKKEK